MKLNFLRTLNERCKNFKVFSIEGFHLVLAMAVIPNILSLFLPINLKYLSWIYFGMGIALFIDKLFMEKEYGTR